MDDSEEVCYELLATALEMGEAVTQAGAASIAAAFFRKQVAACAWADEELPTCTLITKRSHETGISEASSLRFPLGVCHEEHALVSSGSVRELVVSRGGAGPDFSPKEKRVCAKAAALLDQALCRIRHEEALVATKAALESSLRGMEEASTVVAVMTEERKQRVEVHEQARTELRQNHERELSAVREELRRSCEEASELQRRLQNMERSVGAVASAANDLCRVAAVDCTRAKTTIGCVRGEAIAAEDLGNGSETRMTALVEGAARRALRCPYARVEYVSEPRFPTTSRVFDGGWREGNGGGFGRYSVESKEDPAAVFADKKWPGATMRIPVLVPQSGADEALVLSICSEDQSRMFVDEDDVLASALAACLGTAILASRARRRVRELAEETDADLEVRREREQAANAAATADAAEARCRAERAAADTRALITTARGLKAQAESAAAACRRAERQTEALWHLLVGLHSARRDHAAIATAVTERAVAVVPACERAVLLTPRQGRRWEKMPEATEDRDRANFFSPDPRVWASAASGKRGRRSERGGRSGVGKGWAGTIERAALKAVAEGKTVCVRDRFDGATVSPQRVFCFSPLSQSAMTPQPGRYSRAERGSENVRPKGGDQIDRVDQTGSDADGSCSAVCAIAWVLRLNKTVARVGSHPIDVEPVAAWSLPPLPERVSTVIEVVGLAVSLALFAPSDKLSGALARRYACADISTRSQEGSRDHEMKRRREKESRDAELERLRRETAALASRVQTLECKAAGLRASEARSSSALARAEADAMAAKGELELVALERDRLARRLDHGQADEGKRPQGSEKSLSDAQPSGDHGWYKALPSAGSPTVATRLFSGPSPAEPLSAGDGIEDDNSSRSGERTMVGALLSSQAGDGVKIAEGTKILRVGDADGGMERRDRCFALRGDELQKGRTVASSEALQRMASVHARLSDSLRRGLIGPTPRKR